MNDTPVKIFVAKSSGWTSVRVLPDDVEYVRADVHKKIEEQLEEALSKLAAIVLSMNDAGML